MTQVLDAPTAGFGGGATAPPPKSRAQVLTQVANGAGTLISVLLLVFVAEMALLGPVQHARSQSVLYDEFRGLLAAGEAPTGQTDINGKLLAPGDPVALITIPSVDIKEVVGEGTTAGVLMAGPGHRRDTPLPGQPGTSIIYGRQATYGGPFGALADIKVGAEISVVTGQGPQLFKVVGLRRPGDTLEAPDPAAGRLTLITGSGREYLASDALRVDAELVSPVQAAPTRTLTAASLTRGEGVMVGDTGALLPLLLWSQLLLVLVAALAWLRSVWGRWQSWIVSVPLLGVVGFAVAHQIAQLLPNLL